MSGADGWFSMSRLSRIGIRASRTGHGVYALSALAARRRVLEFGGPRVSAAAVASSAAAGEPDVYLQIGLGDFLGRSGLADDFVNHCCVPNCFVEVAADGVYLVTLTEIAAGTELNFDYGITQLAFPFRFRCLCGSAQCRGEVGNCDEIPPARLAYYRAAGAIPRFVLARLDGTAPAAVAPSAPPRRPPQHDHA